MPHFAKRFAPACLSTGLFFLSPMAIAEPVTSRAALKPLSFFSKSLPYRWDVLLPVDADVDGLKIKTIFFNRRTVKSGLLKGSEFGTRAQVEVTNTSGMPRIPGFAVAVFDAEGRLLGVASGGTKIGSVKPGETETFDLNFTQVQDRLPLGTTFTLSVELRN